MNGIPDAEMWKLTREAETDEAMISKLKEELSFARLQEQELTDEVVALRAEKRRALKQLFDLTEYFRLQGELFAQARNGGTPLIVKKVDSNGQRIPQRDYWHIPGFGQIEPLYDVD